MKENFIAAAKIGGKTALKWAFIFIIGNVVTIITFLIAFFGNAELAGSGHGTIIGLFIGLLTNNFFAFLLIFGAPVFIALYIVVANKTSIQNVIYQLWQGKMGDYISSKVGAIAKNITDKEGWRKDLSDKALLKAKILQLAKNDEDTSKLQRRVISYGFKKIRLDDINFQDENLALSDILTQKFNNFISDTTKPSLNLFWVLVLLQIALLIGSFILK